MLYDKWWKNPGDTCTRNEKGKESKANALGVDNIGGVFVVLLCGLAVAVIVAIFEFCYNSKRSTQAEMVCIYEFSHTFWCRINSFMTLSLSGEKYQLAVFQPVFTQLSECGYQFSITFLRMYVGLINDAQSYLFIQNIHFPPPDSLECTFSLTIHKYLTL
jgi:hypothetical protein